MPSTMPIPMAATFLPTVQYSTPGRSSETTTWKAAERNGSDARSARVRTHHGHVDVLARRVELIRAHDDEALGERDREVRMAAVLRQAGQHRGVELAGPQDGLVSLAGQVHGDGRPHGSRPEHG